MSAPTFVAYHADGEPMDALAVKASAYDALEQENVALDERVKSAKQILNNAEIAINAGDGEWAFVQDTLKAITTFLAEGKQ